MSPIPVRLRRWLAPPRRLLRSPPMHRILAIVATAHLLSCAGSASGGADAGRAADGVSDERLCAPEPGLGGLLRPAPEPEFAPHPDAGALVLYELQVRSANACHPAVGAAWQREACAAKVSPEITYRATDSRCAEADALAEIRLGTLDDLLADTDDPRVALSLRYIEERVGANAVWLMPIFPNNDRRLLPAPCDNLGSPYAVRDYLHTRGSLSAACILEGRDDPDSEEPCWGDDALRSVIDEAHARGLRVLVDIALNHFGHDYHLYDTEGATPVRDWLAAGLTPEDIWDFEATFDPALVGAIVLDDPARLAMLAAGNAEVSEDLVAVDAACPGLGPQARVRAYGMWRLALDHERADFACGAGATLESTLPGFYLHGEGGRPATAESETTTRYGWDDVKFLFHRADAPDYTAEFLRVREYGFRIVNALLARGVDGFRLDHTTDGTSGMSPGEWAYIMAKASWYAERRGQGRPIFLAEEFHDQVGMNRVADIMTEGYLFDMNGRGGGPKTAARVEQVLSRAGRFAGSTYVLTALETHDELRLLTDTGFDPWTGAGFWAAGATIASAPMLLAGQELGARSRLDFRRSTYLAVRFDGSSEDWGGQADLADLYRRMIRARLGDEGAALRARSGRFLRPPGSSAPVDGAVAQLKWTADGDVMLTVHNLWSQDVQAKWSIPHDLRVGVGIDRCHRYRFRDVISGATVVRCRDGSAYSDGFEVWIPAATRTWWARLEECE